MSFSIESLRCFEAAASCLSFGVAAGRVALSPTAFSERIKRLEQDLGKTLFERSTRRVALTKHGLQLLPHARQLLLDARRCQAVFSDDRTPVKLVIGTRFELGLSWLVPELGALQKAAPHRQLDLSFGDGPELLRQLKSGRIDAMVSSMRLTTPGLAYASLHEERYVFVATKRSAVDPLAAHALTLLDTNEDLPLFRYFIDAYAGARQWHFGRVECLGTIAAVRHRALAGVGVCVLPYYFVQQDLARRRLVTLMPRVTLASDYFRLVWRADHPLQDALSALGVALRRVPLR